MTPAETMREKLVEATRSTIGVYQDTCVEAVRQFGTDAAAWMSMADYSWAIAVASRDKTIEKLRAEPAEEQGNIVPNRPGSQSLKVASKVFGDTQRTEKKCHHHVECDCESAGEDGKKYNDPDACQHVWVKVENLKVQGTMLCTLCGNIKAAGEGEHG